MDKLERAAKIKAELDSLFTWSWVEAYGHKREDDWHNCRVWASELADNPENQKKLSAVLEWQGGMLTRMYPHSVMPYSPFAFDFIARLKD